MTQRRITRLTVDYDDGQSVTYRGDGSSHVYTTPQKQRIAEGADSNSDKFIKVVIATLHCGEVPAPKG
jgi:hypothetical protein